MLHCHYNKITKGPGISNFHYVAMLMMTSHILKFVDFAKTQKSRYLVNETLSLLQIKKINCTSRATLWQAKNIAKAQLTSWLFQYVTKFAQIVFRNNPNPAGFRGHSKIWFSME